MSQGSKIHDLTTLENKARKQAEAWIVNRARLDEGFRQRLVSNPLETVSKELNLKFPSNFNIQVVEEGDNRICIVLPARSSMASEELLDSELEMVAGGKGGRPPVTGGDDSHTATLTSSGDFIADEPRR